MIFLQIFRYLCYFWSTIKGFKFHRKLQTSSLIWNSWIQNNGIKWPAHIGQSFLAGCVSRCFEGWLSRSIKQDFRTASRCFKQSFCETLGCPLSLCWFFWNGLYMRRVILKSATAASFLAFVRGFSLSQVLFPQFAWSFWDFQKASTRGHNTWDGWGRRLRWLIFKNPLGQLLIDNCHAFFTSQGCLPGTSRHSYLQ